MALILLKLFICLNIHTLFITFLFALTPTFALYNINNRNRHTNGITKYLPYTVRWNRNTHTDTWRPYCGFLPKFKSYYCQIFNCTYRTSSDLAKKKSAPVTLHYLSNEWHWLNCRVICIEIWSLPIVHLYNVSAKFEKDPSNNLWVIVLMESSVWNCAYLCIAMWHATILIQCISEFDQLQFIIQTMYLKIL